MRRAGVIIFIVFILVSSVEANAEMTVYFLDVGQGDSTVIDADGHIMIIDGGLYSESDKIFSFLRNKLNAEKIEIMIATHPHADHVGGLSAALNEAPVEVLLTPVTEWDSKSFQYVIKYANAQGTPIIIPEEGSIYSLGEAKITILHCWPEAWGTNDMSIVSCVQYGDTSVLIMGDAEYMSEYMILDQWSDINADVIRLGHHGSHTSTTKEFIEKVNPEYAIISCGKNNEYGHPHAEVVSLLKEKDIPVYRTDMQGTITLITDGKEIEIQTERNTTEDLYSHPEYKGE